jgi:hypothetical protein
MPKYINGSLALALLAAAFAFSAPVKIDPSTGNLVPNMAQARHGDAVDIDVGEDLGDDGD